MYTSLTIKKNLLIFGIPLSLFGVLILLMRTPSFSGVQGMNLAITLDLLLTVPVVYFLLIRKTKIPKTTVIPMMVLGLIIGSYFLPQENQTYLSLFKTWVFPLVELSVLTFVIIKVKRAITTYKSLKGTSPDFYNTLKNTCHQLLPQKLVPVMTTEIAVIYYGFIHWKKQTLSKNEFSYHRKTGTQTLFIAFIFIIAIEMFTVHTLLAKWSFLAAWILTGLSAYSAMQIWGFAKSLAKRPISVQENRVYLKYGILSEVEISLSDIKQIALSNKTPTEDPLFQLLSPIGEMEGHNMIIYLSKEYNVHGLYGIKKKFTSLGLHVDHPDTLKQFIESRRHA